jgi:hypothetical protein
MHIHHNPMTSSNAGIHSAAAAEKAAATQRASDTRRKLLKSASQIDGSLNAGELFMIGKWSDEHADQRPRQPPRPQKEAQAEEEPGVKPISVWV